MKTAKFPELAVAVFALALTAGGAELQHNRDEWDRRARETSKKYAAGEISAAMADWQQLAKEAESFSMLDVRRTLVLHNLGALNVELGHPREALGYLEEAARRMERTPYPGLIEEKTLNFLATAYIETGNYAKAERALQAARRKALAQPENGGENLTTTDLLESKILLERGRAKEAEAMVRGALQRVEQRGPMALEEQLSLWNQMGIILAASRRWSEAGEVYRRTAEALRQRLGERHPSTAKAQINLSEALLRGGRAAEAEQMAGQAVRVLTETVGPGHDAVGVALQRQAAALRALKRGKEAKELERRASRIAESYEKNNQIGSTVDLEALAYRVGR